MGVTGIRLSPQAQDFAQVLERFQRHLEGDRDALNLSDQDCNGYWFGQPGMARIDHP
jgi:hypothetical protein